MAIDATFLLFNYFYICQSIIFIMKRVRTNIAVRGRGRPSNDALVFRADFIRQVYYLCLLGATDSQIAKVFNVTEKSIELWKRTKPEFLASMKEGKAIADAKVAHSLFLSATGYSCEETTVITNKVKTFNDKGRVIAERTEPILVKTIKNYPPNAVAAIKWLSARQPEKWSEKVQVESKLTIANQIDLTIFSTEELVVLSRLGLPNVSVKEIGEGTIETAEIIE